MRRRVAMALAVVSLFGLAACGDDSSDTAADDTVGEATTTTETKATVLTATIDDKAISLSAKTVEAGLVEFVITNQGKGMANVSVVSVEAGKTEADLKVALGADQDAPPAWAKLSGGPTVAAGGASKYQTVVTEGQWALVIPAEDGPPKTEARWAMLTVTPSTKGNVSLPSTDAVVSGTEYAYEVKGLKAGTNKVTVKNTGGLPHIYVVFEMTPDGKLDEVLAHQGEGPPPGIKGEPTNLGYLDGGKSGILEHNFTAGRYGMACFLTNAPGGKQDKPHFQLGMKTEFTVS